MEAVVQRKFAIVAALSGVSTGAALLARLALNTVILRPLEGWTVSTEDVLLLVSQNRTPFVLAAALALLAAILMIPFFLALPRESGTSGPGLAGATFAVAGAVVLAIGILGSLFTSLTLADLYGNAADPEPVVTTAQAMGALVGGLVVGSTLLLGVGFTATGLAMIGSPLWNRYGWLSLVFGAIFIAGPAVRALGPFTVATSLPPLLFFPFLPLGWKLYRVSSAMGTR